jgi:hypothetical protein
MTDKNQPREYRVEISDGPSTLRHALKRPEGEPAQMSLRSGGEIGEQTRENTDNDQPDFVAAFRAINAAADDYEYDVDVEAKTYNDLNYYVVLQVKGKGVALEPNLAREIADDLYEAASEAESKEAEAVGSQSKTTEA